MSRGRFAGVGQIVKFNWPVFVGGVVGIAACVVAVAHGVLPWLAGIAGAIALYHLVATLVVAHWTYDRAGLYELTWLDRTPQRWAVLHAGLDEITEPIERRVGTSPFAVIDFFDPQYMTEASVYRARQYGLVDPRTVAAPPDRLPLAPASCDGIFLVMCAHELRTEDSRVALFREVRRALSSCGVAYVVEHMRDAANFAVFGGGFLHFLSHRTWQDTFRKAGLRVEETPINPFLRLFRLTVRSQGKNDGSVVSAIQARS